MDTRKCNLSVIWIFKSRLEFRVSLGVSNSCVGKVKIYVLINYSLIFPINIIDNFDLKELWWDQTIGSFLALESDPRREAIFLRHIPISNATYDILSEEPSMHM